MITNGSTREPFCIRCNQTRVRLMVRNEKHRIGICESCIQPGETDVEATTAILRYISEAKATFETSAGS